MELGEIGALILAVAYTVLAVAVIFLLPRLVRWLLRKIVGDQVAQVVSLVLFAVLVALAVYYTIQDLIMLDVI